MSVYRFPRARFADDNNVYQQLKHIQSELNEAFSAWFGCDDEHCAHELIDLIHATETALRIIEEKRKINVEQLMKDVKKKNAERGYYETKVS